MTDVKPTPEGFRVALDALVHDANIWDGGGGAQGSSQLLKQTGDRAAGLGIHSEAFLLIPDVGTIYERVRGLYVERSGQGSTAHHDLGADLRDARTTYLRADQAALHDANKIW